MGRNVDKAFELTSNETDLVLDPLAVSIIRNADPKSAFPKPQFISPTAKKKEEKKRRTDLPLTQANADPSVVKHPLPALGMSGRSSPTNCDVFCP